MAKPKPEAYFEVEPYKDSFCQWRTHKTAQFSTYRELRKRIGELTNESVDGKITVTRSRRGCWGEWFELWDGGKIVREGWL